MNIMSKVLNKGLYISLFVAVIFFSANSYQRSLDADLPKIKKSFLFSIFDFEFNLADFDVLELISIEKDGVRFLVYTSEYEPTSINAASMQEVVSLILYDANSLSGKNRLGLKRRFSS